MKNQQQQEAKDLYFQTTMSKTEIAQKVGVARKTVLFWSQQGNWDKLRMSARNMPSLVAEKCYYLIDQYMNTLLSDANSIGSSTLHLKDAQIIHLLATSIKKMKNRSTVNESMEMFNFFLDGLSRRDPALAQQVAPQIEEYITIRRGVETTDFLIEEFTHDGKLPFPDKEIQERWADERDTHDLNRDFEQFIQDRYKPDPVTEPAAAPSEAPSPAHAPQAIDGNDSVQLQAA